MSGGERMVGRGPVVYDYDTRETLVDKVVQHLAVDNRESAVYYLQAVTNETLVEAAVHAAMLSGSVGHDEGMKLAEAAGYLKAIAISRFDELSWDARDSF